MALSDIEFQIDVENRDYHQVTAYFSKSEDQFRSMDGAAALASSRFAAIVNSDSLRVAVRLSLPQGMPWRIFRLAWW